MLSLGFKAKLYAVFAAIGLALMATIKILTAQRNAARTDAKRAKAHWEEQKKIRKVEKDINLQTKKDKAKAVEAIQRGEMPDNIRDRNTF